MTYIPTLLNRRAGKDYLFLLGAVFYALEKCQNTVFISEQLKNSEEKKQAILKIANDSFGLKLEISGDQINFKNGAVIRFLVTEK